VKLYDALEAIVAAIITAFEKMHRTSAAGCVSQSTALYIANGPHLDCCALGKPHGPRRENQEKVHSVCYNSHGYRS